MNGDVLEAGDIIGGKYEIRSPIGRGGFSHVYRGVHRAMNRTVAIKIFDPENHGGETAHRTAWRAERFEQEARLVSQLTHPNTVTIFDYGMQDDRRAYLVMEYIEGRTLDEVIRQEGSLSRERTVTLFLQVLESLEEAHHKGILHRDLKPANIMVTTNFKGEEIAKVLDFGIARLVRDNTQAMRPPDDDGSKKRLFLGTPRYAAPEQLALRELTLATDIYCVGALLWESILGRPMVPSGDVRECIRLAAHPDPWKMPADADIDPDLEKVIKTAVAKDPSYRYQNATQMMEALEGCTSVVRSDLPDIEPTSPFSSDQGILDPNVEPDASESHFLNPDGPSSPPPTPYAAVREADPSRLPPSHRESKRQKKTPPSSNRSSSQAPRTPSSQHTTTPELSTSPAHTPSTSPSTVSTPGASSSRRPHRAPISPPDHRLSSSDDDSRQVMIFAVIVAIMALGGAAAVAGLWLSSQGQEEVVTEAALTEEDDHSEEADDFETPVAFDDGLFTIDSVALAMERFDWDVERAISIHQMTDYLYEQMRLSHEDDIVDLHVYDTADPQVMAKKKSETELPDYHVMMGPLFVRISPTDEDEAPAASATDELRQFRDMVLEEAGYK